MRRAFRRVVLPSIRSSRLLLALKSAIAAGLAWFAGRLLPGVDEYSYYAPLGALIIMMPTLMGSLRSTVQMLIGLALGILLAWAIILSPLPGAVSVALAVGIGVVLAGLGGLGSGAEYVPIAALFMLVIGGSDPEEFSMGYLLQMGLGMLVGVIVNLAVMPPLWLRESSESIGDLRRRLAETLEGLAEAVADGLAEGVAEEVADATSELDASRDRVRSLERSVRQAQSVVADAAESRRLNPRSRRHPYDIDEDFDDLEALDRLSAHLRSLVEDLQEAAKHDGFGADDPVARASAEVLHRLADLVRAWDARHGGAAALAEADAAVERLERLHERETRRTGATAGLSFDAHRMSTLIGGRLRADDREAPRPARDAS